MDQFGYQEEKSSNLNSNNVLLEYICCNIEYTTIFAMYFLLTSIQTKLFDIFTTFTSFDR